jgi:hypothetical protein
LGSLFSGSGGFELAGKLCGIQPLWASEIEPFPIRVTTKRLPEVQHLGDVRAINGAKIPPVDIISFGSPCTNLSVAGRREGLTGKESSLFYEAIRIIKEMKKETHDNNPRYIIFENVPGLFSSSNREDFRQVLTEIVQIAEPGVPDESADSLGWKTHAEVPACPKDGWPPADVLIILPRSGFVGDDELPAQIADRGQIPRAVGRDDIGNIGHPVGVRHVAVGLTVQNIFVSQVAVWLVFQGFAAADHRKQAVPAGDAQDFFVVNMEPFVALQPFLHTPVAEPIFIRFLAFGDHIDQRLIGIFLPLALAKIVISLPRNVIKIAHLTDCILPRKPFYDRENLRFPHFPSVSIRKFRSSSTSISRRAIRASGVSVWRGVKTRTVSLAIGVLDSGAFLRSGIPCLIRYLRHHDFTVSWGTPRMRLISPCARPS